ncbi:MAG: 30S ribosomal protein S12 methylthiotransferase RimO [Bacteroidia bacterium]|nr:30S ribosomal protein S12 methylthiotransferase RimO [Bacteroidia bacterium]
MRTRRRTAPRINIVTLGCSKNRVDSENLLTQLQASALDARHESTEAAEVVVVNTCGFIDKAKQESIDTILHYAAAKTAGDIEKLYVTGCLSERYRDELTAEMPEVDAFFGTLELPALVARLGADYKHHLLGERIPTTARHYAYLKIAEGCNRPCGFCAIPLMRGGHVSRPIEALVDEAHWLVSRGVKELLLIAQELTFYGQDLYGRRRLADLLHALAEVDGLRWIRLHYAYPAGFPLDVIDAMAAHPNICRYLDLPLQHAADNVLQRMRRGITRAKTEDLLATLRARLPGIALRTTLLVGYPGETEADHQELLSFIERMQFDRLGVFTYSHEEGTHAGKTYPDDVPEATKQARAEEVMALQHDISLAHNQRRIGQILPVVIDRQEGRQWVGRTEYDSPEVDGEVYVTSPEPLTVGAFYPVRITGAEPYDLIGEVTQTTPLAG